MRVGYARVSTADRQVAGFEAQQRDLTAAGCEKIFGEELSSVAASRPQLCAAIDFVREGDILVVTKIDRLARSIVDLIGIVEKIRAKGAAVEIGGLGLIDGNDAISKLTMNMLGVIAEFERDIMLARQREGIAKAKAEGKYRGRVPTARRQAGEVKRLVAEGVAKTEIARRLGIARSSVYEILAER